MSQDQRPEAAVWKSLKTAARRIRAFLTPAQRISLRLLRFLRRSVVFLWRQEPVRLTLTLFLFAAIVSGFLASVNGVTEGPIAGLRAETLRAAMDSVRPGSSFEETALPASFGDPSVTAFYTALRGGEVTGYVAAVEAAGFGGVISMVVGLTETGDVAGVAIVEMSETPNLGSRAEDPGWLSGFIGATAGLRLGDGSGNTVEAITGATITSEAVTTGVIAALGAAASFLSGGGPS